MPTVGLTRLLRRPCIQCRTWKKACNRYLPACQSCSDRREPIQCTYEEHTSSRLHPSRKASVESGKSKQKESAHESEQTRENLQEKYMTIEARDESGQDSQAPFSPAASGFTPCLMRPYYEMTVPVSLPRRLQTRIPKSCAPSAEKSHTLHQLLLVLNYLFVSAMFPNDKDLLWLIIYRRAQDWEQSFVLQHSGLQPWLIDIRDALTNSQGLHTVPCEDLEVQIRYILFLLGRYASKGSSFLQACFEQPLAPYRPFGVGASVALICYAFMGISTNHIRGYESKEIWARDESFFFIMLDQLRKSPIFSPELSVGELQAILLDLQRAFHNEEIRVASVSAQEINIRNRVEVINYYTQAFQVLNPFLLPKISLDALGIKPPENCSHLHLATLLATVFYDRHPTQSLNEDFKNIPGIMLSKPDRVVVTEMFHVKAWQESWWNGSSDKFYVSVFHVAPGPETKTQSG